MTAELLASHADAEVYHASWVDLLDVVRARGGCDSIITDTPYSAETHAGHGTMERWGTSTPPAYDGAERREINYAEWTDVDVEEFVGAWAPLVRGWFISVTDDNLAPTWKRALRAAGRHVFPLIPCTERGATVRMANDGPPSCTTFAVVARPRAAEMLRWGVTESHYVGPREKKPVIGGKPMWLARAFVRDYTRPGDLVVDPCCGGGTFGAAAVERGRRTIAGDAMRAHASIAAARIVDVASRPRLFAPGDAAAHTGKRKTLALFGSDS